jgi:chromosome segregation ATPase
MSQLDQLRQAYESLYQDWSKAARGGRATPEELAEMRAELDGLKEQIRRAEREAES